MEFLLAFAKQVMIRRQKVQGGIFSKEVIFVDRRQMVESGEKWSFSLLVKWIWNTKIISKRDE